jgi:predicted DNA-binding transcriptional regulator AlpA
MIGRLKSRRQIMRDDRQVKYIRAKQLEERYGIDRITAWRWSRDRSKGFPKAIRLAPNVSVYDKAEVDAWFEARRVECVS